MPQYPSTMSPLRNPPAMSDSQRSVRGTASVDENTRCSLRADLMPTLSAILRDMGEAGVEMDLRHGDLREGVAEPLEVFIEVAVGAHVDQHHLEVAVLLGQDQRQPLLDEGVVLREHRHHDRHRGSASRTVGRRLLR